LELARVGNRIQVAENNNFQKSKSEIQVVKHIATFGCIKKGKGRTG